MKIRKVALAAAITVLSLYRVAEKKKVLRLTRQKLPRPWVLFS